MMYTGKYVILIKKGHVGIIDKWERGYAKKEPCLSKKFKLYQTLQDKEPIAKTKKVVTIGERRLFTEKDEYLLEIFPSREAFEKTMYQAGEEGKRQRIEAEKRGEQ